MGPGFEVIVSGFPKQPNMAALGAYFTDNARLSSLGESKHSSRTMATDNRKGQNCMLKVLALLLSSTTLGVAGSQPAPRPPDGTYSYALYSNGKALFTSTIVVSQTKDTVIVSEDALLGKDREALVKTTYNNITLLPTQYEVHQRALGSNTDLSATVDPDSAQFHGIPLAYKTQPGTSFLLMSEGLIAIRVMMPAIMLAHGSEPFTIATLNGNTTITGRVVAPSSPQRPPGVALEDAAMVMQLGGALVTTWYDPHTLVPHQVDLPGNASIHLVRYDSHAATLSPPSRATPMPMSPPHYTNRLVSVASKGAILSGTLSVPGNGSYPAIILVHGSGPATREGGTQANPTFRELANSLANKGVAVLRYDKRGIGQSTGTATEDWHALGDDVEATVAYMRHQPHIDPRRIFVLGHSEGAFVVLRLANDMPIRGVATMGGPALPIPNVVAKQDLAQLNNAQRAMLQQAFKPYAGIDPANLIRGIRVPILLLQGGKDTQALASDFPRLTKAAKVTKRRYTSLLFPEDDHLFITLPHTQAAESDEIFRPHVLDPRVPAAILAWIRSLS